jgi:hypothetical protein
MDQAGNLQHQYGSKQSMNRPPHYDLTILSEDQLTSSWSQRLKHGVHCTQYRQIRVP